jgi:hypothetical protein
MSGAVTEWLHLPSRRDIDGVEADNDGSELDDDFPGEGFQWHWQQVNIRRAWGKDRRNREGADGPLPLGWGPIGPEIWRVKPRPSAR